MVTWGIAIILSDVERAVALTVEAPGLGFPASIVAEPLLEGAPRHGVSMRVRIRR
jgi:hypothetical protein